MERPPGFPLFHLNGTDPRDFYEACSRVTNLLRQALTAALDTCPNGRDYYMLPKVELKIADEQHQSRMNRIQTLIDEYYALMEWAAENIR